jgi:hypothetical protein
MSVSNSLPGAGSPLEKSFAGPRPEGSSFALQNASKGPSSGTSVASLSRQRRFLLQVFQQIRFGRIENLHLSHAEPVIGSDTRLIKTRKLDALEDEVVIRYDDDFAIKSQVAELFKHFDCEQEGIISRIEIRFGLPCFAELILQLPKELNCLCVERGS